MTLPSREDSAWFVENYNKTVGPVDIGPQYQSDSAIAIVNAYADGTLKTGQEWRDSLNYTAFAQVIVDWVEADDDDDPIGAVLGRGILAATKGTE